MKINFSRKLRFALLLCLALLLLAVCTGCLHEHKWSEGSCVQAPYCVLCGKDYKGDYEKIHAWEDAKCYVPKRCKLCDLTEGGLAEHKYKEATCEEPKTCTGCYRTEGEKADHTWLEAECNLPKRCLYCRAIEGDTLGHAWVEANCQAPQTCSRCQITKGGKGDHVYNKNICDICNEKVIQNYNDLRKYLNKHFHTMETKIGNVSDITYEIVDKNTSIFSSVDFTIRIDTRLYCDEKGASLELMLGSSLFSYSDRVQALCDLFEFEYKVAQVAMEAFPDKKIDGSFFYDGYEYPSLQVGYQSHSYLGFRNYRSSETVKEGYDSTELCEWHISERFGERFTNEYTNVDWDTMVRDARKITGIRVQSYYESISEFTTWECNNCRHIHIYLEKPDTCRKCGESQTYVEVESE